MDVVKPDADVLISAQGLLTYFQPADVFALITDCAQRFPAIATLIDLRFPPGRGLWRWPTLVFESLPVLHVHRPAISLVTFADHVREV